MNQDRLKYTHTHIACIFENSARSILTAFDATVSHSFNILFQTLHFRMFPEFGYSTKDLSSVEVQCRFNFYSFSISSVSSFAWMKLRGCKILSERVGEGGIHHLQIYGFRTDSNPCGCSSVLQDYGNLYRN